MKRIKIKEVKTSSLKIQVGNQRRINVALEEEVVSMNELVVVGYGARKKVNYAL